MNLSFNLILNSGAQLASRIISTLTTFVITYLITKNLSKEIWGDFVTITSYLALFSLISNFGLNGIVIKKITAEASKEVEYFKQLFGLRLVLSLVSIFLALAVMAFLPYSTAVKLGIIVGSFLLLAQGIFNSATAIFQSKSHYGRYALSDIVGSVTILALVFLAVYLKAGLLTIIFVYLVGNFAQSILGLVLAQNLLGFRGFSFSISTWQTFIVAALPLGIMMIFIQINSNIDKQILALSNYTAIGGITAAVAVGIYGLAYRIFDLLISLPSYVVNFAYPFMLESHQKSREDFAGEVRRLSAALLGIGTIVSVVIWFSAPFILSFFGSYREAVVPLRVLTLGIPLFFVTPVLLWTAVTLNRELLLPFIYGFAALVNIVLNLIFIPRYGYNGAAWVTVICEVIILSGLVLILSELKLIKLPTRNEQITS